MKKLVITALIAFNAAACGSIVRGTTEQVSFISEPSGAAMATNLKYACPATPCTLEVERSDEFDATFSKPGYRPTTIPVRTKVVTKGAAGFAGNLLAGGVVGMGVDAYTGAAMDHDPNPVFARLSPDAAPRTRRTGPAAGAPGM
ncbi:translation initiation factor 2 [Methylobacterium symbioticum]|jgi:hypothetical protein|uniref:Translation initiation factor 2 n=1 Tax=Methylobacterium symbioticum TaxID=2584084 RepID=A0A509EL42_9HYPH|nr:translation initiation factor 2 [Methylobacterium symbioticum]VUD74752.1 hypothetical protein MET9862_05385 [Methylobacterium symbioticum]